jgi:hypothetical protein
MSDSLKVIEPIECSFVGIPQHVCLFSGSFEEQKLKSGKYHGSQFALTEEQKNSWPVCVYIQLNTQYIGDKSEQDVIDGCLKFLNKPHKSRKTKKITYEYGFLTAYEYKFKKTENFSYIEAVLLTTDPQNKHFWKLRKKSKSFGGIPSGKKRRITKDNSDG